MRVRCFLPAVITAAATVASAMTLALGVPATAAANPCGFFETGSDAYYNHCTGDGSRVVIEVEVWGPNYEKCMAPGVSWLGSANKIDGAHYVGRTC